MSTIETPAIQAPKEVTTADVLHRAADLLEEFGWCQGNAALDAEDQLAVNLTSRPVKFCAMGATARAVMDLTGRDFFHAGFHSESGAVLERILGESPAAWNDEPGRTKAEVVALLREAAERSTG